jgi:hypothetical protein
MPLGFPPGCYSLRIFLVFPRLSKRFSLISRVFVPRNGCSKTIGTIFQFFCGEAGKLLTNWEDWEILHLGELRKSILVVACSYVLIARDLV